MTAHTLARALLNGPDLPVITIDDDEVPMAVVDIELGDDEDVMVLATDPADDTPRR